MNIQATRISFEAHRQRARSAMQAAVSEYPGEFMMLDKREIHVDETYQRTLNKDKISLIKKDFNWAAFGSIAVARRPDGQLYAIDGQHRVVVAKQIDEIDLLPCLVFEIESIPEEARGFLAINTARKPLTSIDTFNAKVVSGDKIAAEVKKLARDNDYTISKNAGPNVITCVGAIQKRLRDKGEHARAVFPIVADLCRGGVFSRDLFEGMVHLHQKTEGQIVTRDWVRRLERIGVDALKKGMAKSAGYYGRMTEKAFAAGIANELNVGRRPQNRIVIELAF